MLKNIKYYAIEGIDTSGKSTQINLFKNQNATLIDDIYKNDLCKEIKNKIILVSEPRKDSFGEKIRELAMNGDIDSLTRFLLFLAERRRVIKSLRFENNIILSDRSLVSGIAYSSLDINTALNLNLIATDNIMPTKIVILELERGELIKRLESKKLDLIESSGIDNLLNIQKRLILTCKSLKSNHNIEYKIINSSESRECIFKQIRDFYGMCSLS